MNMQRRKALAKAVGLIEEAKEIISTAQSEEQDGFDNLSEGLQNAERGQKMQEAAEALAEAENNLDEVLSSIETATQE